MQLRQIPSRIESYLDSRVTANLVSSGSPPSLLKMEEETFGRPFRRGLETRAEHDFNRNVGEPVKIAVISRLTTHHWILPVVVISWSDFREPDSFYIQLSQQNQ